MNTNDCLVRVYIRLENRIDMYESSGYTLTTMLSDVGGFATLLYAFARIGSTLIAKEMLLGSLIMKLFRVRSLTYRV